MSFFRELKRRNVFRVGAAYMVTSWLVIQVVATIAPILGLPDELQQNRPNRPAGWLSGRRRTRLDL